MYRPPPGAAGPRGGQLASRRLLSAPPTSSHFPISRHSAHHNPPQSLASTQKKKSIFNFFRNNSSSKGTGDSLFYDSEDGDYPRRPRLRDIIARAAAEAVLDEKDYDRRYPPDYDTYPADTSTIAGAIQTAAQNLAREQAAAQASKKSPSIYEAFRGRVVKKVGGTKDESKEQTLPELAGKMTQQLIEKTPWKTLEHYSAFFTGGTVVDVDNDGRMVEITYPTLIETAQEKARAFWESRDPETLVETRYLTQPSMAFVPPDFNPGPDPTWASVFHGMQPTRGPSFMSGQTSAIPPGSMKKSRLERFRKLWPRKTSQVNSNHYAPSQYSDSEGSTGYGSEYTYDTDFGYGSDTRSSNWSGTGTGSTPRSILSSKGSRR